MTPALLLLALIIASLPRPTVARICAVLALLTTVARAAPASITGNNIKLTNVPVQSTAGSVARMLALDATGLGQSVTPSVLWDAIVLTGVNTADIVGLDTALAARQPLDSDLTSIAALTTTAWGRGLLDDADATATRSALSLSNVENTALSTWAGSTNITTLGTVTSGTFSGTLGAISGAPLTGLNASALATGTVPTARLDTAPGGDEAADAGKIPVFGSTGGLTMSAWTVSDANGYVSVDTGGLFSLQATGWAGVASLAWPTDIGDDNSGVIASREWVTAGFLPLQSVSDLLDDGISATQGTMIIRTATGWEALAPGTAGQVLQTGGAGADPSWATGGSGSPGGSTTQVQLNNAGSFGGVAGLTASLTTGALTQSQTTDATTAVYGLTAATSSAASSGNQKWSPFIRQSAKGWGTSAGASQDVSFDFGVQSIQGSTATGNWVLRSSINGGAWTTAVTFGPTGVITTSNTASFGTVSASGNLIIGSDVTLSRVSAGILRMGSADSSSPVAQSLRAQSVSGVSNTAGQNWTFGGSAGTGTGAGGDIVFQTAPAGTSGSTQNARVEAVRIKSTLALCLAGGLEAPKTVTASGTTGDRTIDKMTGSVNFATGATSLVITNSLVTSSSIIIATVASNDATMTSVQAVAGSGTITLYASAAPTAETRVNFLVTN